MGVHGRFGGTNILQKVLKQVGRLTSGRGHIMHNAIISNVFLLINLHMGPLIYIWVHQFTYESINLHMGPSIYT